MKIFNRTLLLSLLAFTLLLTGCGAQNKSGNKNDPPPNNVEEGIVYSLKAPTLSVDENLKLTITPSQDPDSVKHTTGYIVTINGEETLVSKTELTHYLSNEAVTENVEVMPVGNNKTTKAVEKATITVPSYFKEYKTWKEFESVLLSIVRNRIDSMYFKYGLYERGEDIFEERARYAYLSYNAESDKYDLVIIYSYNSYQIYDRMGLYENGGEHNGELENEGTRIKDFVSEEDLPNNLSNFTQLLKRKDPTELEYSYQFDFLQYYQNDSGLNVYKTKYLFGENRSALVSDLAELYRNGWDSETLYCNHYETYTSAQYEFEYEYSYFRSLINRELIMFTNSETGEQRVFSAQLIMYFADHSSHENWLDQIESEYFTADQALVKTHTYEELHCLELLHNARVYFENYSYKLITGETQAITLNQ